VAPATSRAGSRPHHCLRSRTSISSATQRFPAFRQPHPKKQCPSLQPRGESGRDHPRYAVPSTYHNHAVIPSSGIRIPSFESESSAGSGHQSEECTAGLPPIGRGHGPPHGALFTASRSSISASPIAGKAYRIRGGGDRHPSPLGRSSVFEESHIAARRLPESSRTLSRGHVVSPAGSLSRDSAAGPGGSRKPANLVKRSEW
jgi:hypothetical protein